VTEPLRQHEPAQICRNGHCVNAWSRKSPERNRAFCRECGAATITECPSCHGIILGGEDLGMRASENVPKYCVHCGNPMPWMEDAFARTEELIDVIDDLSADEKRALKICLPDLVNETSATPVAALKTGKMIKKLEPHFRDAFKQIMYNLIAAKTQVLLKPYGF
jgi:hypothetical protein